jgi:CHRD domain
MKYLISALTASLLWAGTAAAFAANQQNLQLTGGAETPAVTTTASGQATFTVDDSGVVSGDVKTTGIDGTAAHIHMGKVGASGPPIITLQQAGKDQWTVPQGARLSAKQMAAFKKGDLYVNVHSKSHPAGEIRAQLTAP